MTGIYISDGSRCCDDHLGNGFINKEILDKMTPYADYVALSPYNVNAIANLIQGLRQRAIYHDLFHQFKNPNILDSTICMNTTGYSSQQFNEILQYLIENDEFEMRNSKERKVSQALAIYLYWLNQH